MKGDGPSTRSNRTALVRTGSSFAPPPRPLALTAVGVWALWLGLTLAPPILYDDAAISLRYAERIAAGSGFTYNDDERVCGASNPFFTLLVGSVGATGVDVERAARGISLGFFVATTILVSAVVWAVAGTTAGVLAGLLLPLNVMWRTQALSGLEIPLAASLGLGAILAMHHRRKGLAGVLLGLALWTKLDAVALLVAVVAASWLADRRAPLRLGLIAALVAAPWYVYASTICGSPVPHSLLIKLDEGRRLAVDPFWMLKFFTIDYQYLLWIAAIVLLVTIAATDVRRKWTALALAGWLILHMLAYSSVGLGGEYPWYLAMPIALSIALACSAVMSRHRLSLLALVLLLAASAPQIQETAWRLRSERPPEVWEAFDADRRLAGIFLDQYAGPEEVVESAFGWVAFESRRRFVDSNGLNSVRTLVPDYIVVHGEPWRTGGHAPERPKGYVPLATFDLATRLYSGTTWFTVFGRPSSAIARSGLNESSVDVARLRNHRLAAAWRRRVGTPAEQATH